MYLSLLFFFNDTATTEIYTLSLHDALPILRRAPRALGLLVPRRGVAARRAGGCRGRAGLRGGRVDRPQRRLRLRSGEHTSELQSRQYLVCRLFLLKKKLMNFITSLLPL